MNLYRPKIPFKAKKLKNNFELFDQISRIDFHFMPKNTGKFPWFLEYNWNFYGTMPFLEMYRHKHAEWAQPRHDVAKIQSSTLNTNKMRPMSPINQPKTQTFFVFFPVIFHLQHVNRLKIVCLQTTKTKAREAKIGITQMQIILSTLIVACADKLQ